MDKENITIELKSPTIVELTITGKCNHRCLHCFNPWRTEKENKEINKTLTKVQIDKIYDELSINEVFHVVLSGGEPLTEFETTIYAIKKFSDGKFTIALNSNLSLIKQNHIEQLKTYNIDFILTSLPSSNKKICDEILQVDTFDKIIEGIKLCISNNFVVGVNTVINKNNIETVWDTAKYLSNLGVKLFYASIAIPPLYDLNNKSYFLNSVDIKKLGDVLIKIEDELNMKVSTVTPLPLCLLKDAFVYKSITNKACTGGVTHCTISNNGDIFACSHEEKPYGNIFETGLKNAWDKMISWRNGDNLNVSCRSCDYLKICGGECRILSKAYPERVYDQQVDNVSKLNTETVEYPNGQYTLNNRLRFRREEFGGSICIDETKNIFLDTEGVILFETIQELHSFTCDMLGDYFEIDNSFLIVFNNFLSNGIIIPN